MKRLTGVLLIICVCLSCAGCGLLSPLTGLWSNEDREDQIFRETVDAFLAAVDSRDAGAVEALFSQEALDADGELRADIETLFSIYPDPTASWYFNGMTSGSYSKEYGTKTSAVTGRFPVFAGEGVYWCWLTVRYRDDRAAENEGITQVIFYTGADYGQHFYERGYSCSDEPGLTVCWEHSAETPVRCIEGLPYQFTARNMPLDEGEVLEFLESARSMGDFVAHFGDPCGQWSHSYIYELPDENEEKRYLCIVADSEKIESVSVVSELEWLRSLWKK